MTKVKLSNVYFIIILISIFFSFGVHCNTLCPKSNHYQIFEEQYKAQYKNVSDLLIRNLYTEVSGQR